MPILLTSKELEGPILELSRRFEQPNLHEKVLQLVEPIVKITADQRCPMYLRDDMEQELRLLFFRRLPNIVECYRNGEVKSGNLVDYIFGFFRIEAKHWLEGQIKIECKYVRIDDTKIEPTIFPKTYEKSKLIRKIRLAMEAFYRSRYRSKGQADRASKFAYLILDGKRPIFEGNNLVRFFGGNVEYARQAYSTALVIIRQIIESHSEEMRWALGE